MKWLFPFISEPLLAFFCRFVGVLFVGLMFLWVNVQSGMVLIAEEFSTESVTEEAPNILFAHCLKTYVVMSSTLRVFASLAHALAPKGSEHVKAVLLVLCERGDLIRVPAGTRHWFDMGSAPRFCALRWFNNSTGWVAQFTGSAIADAFPRLD